MTPLTLCARNFSAQQFNIPIILVRSLITKMNVLVYSGRGTTSESVKHCLESLRLHLSPHYAVIAVSEATILNEPWMSKSAMLVIPGGADLPYCQVLNGAGNQKISQFVRKGGKFLGLCAGGYYALSRVEFEVGSPTMEVSGLRELGFFGGICRGCAFKGFMYESHQGSKATLLNLDPELGLGQSAVNYYNGGGVFIDASKNSNVLVMALYDEVTDVGDEERAAIIHCKVGNGDVVLTGTHPEFIPSLAKTESSFEPILNKLKNGESNTRLLMQAILKKLGLKVNEDPNALVPHLTPIYLSSHLNTSEITLLASRLQKNLDMQGNRLEDANDTFIFHDETTDDFEMTESDLFHLEDADLIPKHIKLLNHGGLPDSKHTPYFSMVKYFNELERLNSPGPYGSVLGYGEVVTSTSTLLDKNPALLGQLPVGTTFTASSQIAGRGRGGNVWVNPRGVMALSILFKLDGVNTSNVVTLQYLCGLVLIESVLSYGSSEVGGTCGYDDIPIKIKWPNDLYILKPEYFNSLKDKDQDNSQLMVNDEQKYVKVSGAIINSQFIQGKFHLVWGGGLNVSNEAPTTSINIVLSRLNELRDAKGLPELPPFKHELLLAKFMQILSHYYPVFEKAGMKPFLPMYYKRWFHSNQRVVVDVDGHKNKSCTVLGITDEYGMLVVRDDRTGEKLELQPDGNSFDIFKGLVYKKSK